MPLCDIVTLSKLDSPLSFIISAGVIILILFWFFNSLAFSTESSAPRNSFLRCTNVTSVLIFAKKILQSNAESPPPAITTFLFLYISGSLIMYSIPLSSNISSFSNWGFLGSKLPNPPAIATTGAWCLVPLFVVTVNIPSLSFCYFFSSFS